MKLTINFLVTLNIKIAYYGFGTLLATAYYFWELLMEDSFLLFRQRLIKKRKQLRLTLQALAERSGVSKSIISKIENGKVQPSLVTAASIAEGVSSSLADMLLPEQQETVIHQTSDQHFILRDNNHVQKIISPSPSNLKILYESISPQSTIKIKANFHNEIYIVSINKGLKLKTGDSNYILDENECILISPTIEYFLINDSDLEINFMSIQSPISQ